MSFRSTRVCHCICSFCLATMLQGCGIPQDETVYFGIEVTRIRDLSLFCFLVGGICFLCTVGGGDSDDWFCTFCAVCLGLCTFCLFFVLLLFDNKYSASTTTTTMQVISAGTPTALTDAVSTVADFPIEDTFSTAAAVSTPMAKNTSRVRDIMLRGELTMIVPDADAVLEDDIAKDAVKVGIAEGVGVLYSQVFLVFAKVRVTSVKVAYSIIVPASSGVVAQASIQEKVKDSKRLAAVIQTKMDAAKSSEIFSETVTSNSTPSSVTPSAEADTGIVATTTTSSARSPLTMQPLEVSDAQASAKWTTAVTNQVVSKNRSTDLSKTPSALQPFQTSKMHEIEKWLQYIYVSWILCLSIAGCSCIAVACSYLLGVDEDGDWDGGCMAFIFGAVCLCTFVAGVTLMTVWATYPSPHTITASNVWSMFKVTATTTTSPSSSANPNSTMMATVAITTATWTSTSPSSLFDVFPPVATTNATLMQTPMDRLLNNGIGRFFGVLAGAFGISIYYWYVRRYQRWRMESCFQWFRVLVRQCPGWRVGRWRRDVRDPTFTADADDANLISSDPFLPPEPTSINPVTLRTISSSSRESECVICLDRPRSTFLIPCGHTELCGYCAARLNPRRCPVCRTDIVSIQSRHFR